MNAHVKPPVAAASAPARGVYTALDHVATDLSVIQQLTEAIIRLTNDPAVAAVAEQIGERAQHAQRERDEAASVMHSFVYGVAA